MFCLTAAILDRAVTMLSFRIVEFLGLFSGIYGFLLQNDPIVTIDCGPVQGIFESQSVAYSFRGIPYSEPPLGNLRWRPPVAVRKSNNNCWNGTLNATQFGTACFQKGNPGHYHGSEDCLFINVWTPTLGQQAKLPVAVWIHGGFLLGGYGNVKHYSPTEKLAKETNTVYVSMNYRLNAFGFMALQMLADNSSTKTSGNYGFMDMIEALRWVDRNIEMFGGDKNQVTVFGQSSGGTAIFALLASPLATGLFHRAWLASASPVLNKTATDTYKDNLVFVNNTGCLNVTCLYDLSPEKIVDSIPWKEYPYWAMADQQTLPEKGLFDGALAIVDGYVLKETPFDAFVHRRGNDVPVMVGTTAQETDSNPPYSHNISAWNQSTYENKVRQKLSTFSDVIAETALRLYLVTPQTPTPVYEYLYTSMTSDVRMTCGNDYLSLILATSFKSPVYRYVFTYIPSQPFAFRANATFLMKFSVHGMDVGGFYKTMGDLAVSPEHLSDADNAFQNVMRQEMTSFIVTGRPNSTDWYQFPKKTATISDGVRVVPGYHTAECQFWLANGFFSYSWIN